ncbi:Gfo/Idh/MocA family protein [Sporolactobacillus laevolacticus]|uniref:Oxidoreductase n=1 Tax=Sporolactobacillus laevolacticus DSM 442 TaxID=1395513 RepID=V6IXR2_9BACL|nr:Gfo/Idh/MocA family oxidoreductase [Sporolactobacillus laevolacticus]EST12152.1 oxidoreductase [Sporolactobacillus laevolacticus DSM 442]
MLKVGVIGLGSIAMKAYLPVYAGMSGIEFYFCTRNKATLEEVRAKYRWTHLCTSIDELLKQGIHAAFVHAATHAHPKIIEQLILHGIAVYTDKPIADHYEGAKRLTELTEVNHVLLMTGFNRRFAPFIAKASLLPNKTMVICQKNRVNDPKDLRTAVFDDFIHVIDTARFLLGKPINSLSVHASMNEEHLCSGISVILRSGDLTALAIMNRVSGANQELAQVMSPQGEYIIKDLTEMEWVKSADHCIEKFGDWTGTLQKRGFEPIIYAFLDAVQQGKNEPVDKQDALETHRLCEWIVEQAESNL